MAWCTEGASTSTMRCDAFVFNAADSNLSALITNRGTVAGYKAQAAGNSWNSTGILPSTLPSLTTTPVPFEAAMLMVYFSA